MKKTYWILFLILLAGLVFAGRVRTLTEVTHPFEFHIDENNIYITEGVTVFIYSKKDYGLVKKFGKEGEGPQEILLRRKRGSTQIRLISQKKHLVISTEGKLIYYTKEGEFVKEIKTTPRVRGLSPFGEFFVGKKFLREKDALYHGVALYDTQMKQLKLIYKQIHGRQGTNAEFNPLTIDMALFELSEEKIFILDGTRTTISCYDKIGKPLFSITIKDEWVKFSEQDKKTIVSSYRTNAYWRKIYETRRHLFKFPKFLPPISNFAIDQKEKKIYIKTEKKEKEKRKWLVYDFKGRLVQKIFLPIGELRFYGGSCYRLLWNEESDEWELYVSKMEVVEPVH